MLERLLTRLHARLLGFYPARFQEEFGGEMKDVFSQELSGLINSSSPPAARRLKMTRSFFREVWYFPLAYLDARRYKASLGAGETPVGEASYGDNDLSDDWLNRRASWGEALLGALPFLLFGMAYLLEGIAELGGHFSLAFNLLDGTLLDGPPTHPVITLTLPIGVYIVSVLGLLFGVKKGFPRWSYAYLGMSFYFGWYYGNGRFYGVVYDSWAWLPTVAAILMGLLLARSFEPLVRLFKGIWNDWTRLSFALYTFYFPMFTVVDFDGDWGISHLYILIFDTLLLAAGAVFFLRSRTSWGRVLSMSFVVLVLVVKGLIAGGWFDRQGWIAFTATLYYLGFLLLPAVLGLLRRGVRAITSQ